MAEIKSPLVSSDDRQEKDAAEGLCRIFVDCLRARKNLQSRPSLGAWRKVFAGLITDFGEKEVVKALDWFVDRVPGDRYFAISNASRFANEFSEIRKAALVDPDYLVAIDCDLDKMLLSQQAVASLPETMKSFGLVIAQRSFEAYCPFHKHLISLSLTGPEKALLDHLRVVLLLEPVSFTVDWIFRLSRELSGFSEYFGNPSGLIFDVHGFRFRRIGQSLTVAWCLDGSRWDSLYKHFI